MTKRISKPEKVEIYNRLVKAFNTDNAAEIARRMGVKPPSVAQWKNGVAVPSTDKLAKVAAETDVTLDWLLTGKTEENQEDEQDYKKSDFYKLYKLIPNAEEEDRNHIQEFLKMWIRRLDKKAQKPDRLNEVEEKSRPR